jgi:hypothetical protein
MEGKSEEVEAWLYPLLRGGVGAPIKQMPRYLNLGAPGEVEQLSNPEQVSDLPRRADYLR